MNIANYNDLLASVTTWMARDDLTPLVPTFVPMFEAKANRALRCRQIERRSYATIDMTTDEPQYVTLPQDFQSMRSVCLSNVTDKPRLQYLSDDEIKDYRSNIGDLIAMPRYFAVFGQEMELVPRPDSNYVLEMVYRSTIPGLSPNNQTNWLIILAPDAYLYGVLMEASVYMQNDQRVPLWLAGMNSAFEALNSLTKDSVN